MEKKHLTKKHIEALMEGGQFLQQGVYECSSVYVMPRRKLHDSGYHMMAVVPMVKDKPLGIAYATADVVEFCSPVAMKDYAGLRFDVPEMGLLRFWSDVGGGGMTVEVIGFSSARILLGGAKP